MTTTPTTAKGAALADVRAAHCDALRAAAATHTLLSAGHLNPAAAEASTARCGARETRAAAELVWQQTWTRVHAAAAHARSTDEVGSIEHLFAAAVEADQLADAAETVADAAMRAAFADHLAAAYRSAAARESWKRSPHATS